MVCYFYLFFILYYFMFVHAMAHCVHHLVNHLEVCHAYKASYRQFYTIILLTFLLF